MASELAAERVHQRLSAADDLVSRLDERVQACVFARGFIERRHFAEAVAWSWTQGAVVPWEDLILHDQAMDVRTPGQAVAAAHAVVLTRRKASLAGSDLISPEGVQWLLGRRAKPPLPAGANVHAAERPDDLDRPSMLDAMEADLQVLERGESSDLASGVRDWLAFVQSLDRKAPPLLRAAAMLEAWWVIDPAPRYRYVGAVLVGAWLRESARVRSHVLGLEVGLRLMGRGRSPEMRAGDPVRRVAFWLAVMSRSAQDAMEELHRLELARQAMAQKVAGRRSHSRAQDVMALLLEHPVVTAPLIAERLRISQHGARRSLDELGSAVQEVSGRSRFRAWRV